MAPGTFLGEASNGRNNSKGTDADESSLRASGSDALLLAYLSRIGIDEDAAVDLIGREPNAADLGLLLRSHLTSVPFENLGQHDHPAAGEDVEAVARGSHVPSLDTHKTLKKIVFDRRGGVCFEINYAFAWLLRSLGYRVRVGSSQVINPDGPVPGPPGHLCLYVDGLTATNTAIHVDPGFGDAPREPMPSVLNNVVVDGMIGDQYEFVPNSDPSAFGQSPEQHQRFPVVLKRSRKVGIGSSPMVDFIGEEAFGSDEAPPPSPEMTPPEPIYLLNFDDDMALDDDEFAKGIAFVLADDEKNVFSQKRICIMVRENGYDFVGEGYAKSVRNGKETSRTKLRDEKSYRAALEDVAGIKL